MKKPKLKAFKAWCLISLNDRQFRIQNDEAMGYLYDRQVLDGNQVFRVIVRDACEDKELLARLAQLEATERVATDTRLYRNGLKRENARLRKEMERALALLHRSAWESNRDMARGVLETALAKKDR